LSEAQKRTPRPSPERRDAKSFPLSPTDGFVLSRIDGTLDESDLAASTGLPESQVQTSLLKLESLGLIVFDANRASAVVAKPPRPPASAVTPVAAVALATSSVEFRAAVVPPAPPPPPPPGKAAPSVSAPTRSVPATPPSAPSLFTGDEQASLLEDVDLEPELRKRVIATYRDLDRRDYYALLGVEENVDRKAIKRAYYEHAAAFHPDRYFRKKLGSFKVRMEAVFAKLTLAHDTLSNKQTRSEYDAYLSEQRIARAIEENLALGLTQAFREQRPSRCRAAAGCHRDAYTSGRRGRPQRRARSAPARRSHGARPVVDSDARGGPFESSRVTERVRVTESQRGVHGDGRRRERPQTTLRRTRRGSQGQRSAKVRRAGRNRPRGR
jgi:curved DNA-binding protein CbpA